MIKEEDEEGKEEKRPSYTICSLLSRVIHRSRIFLMVVHTVAHCAWEKIFKSGTASRVEIPSCISLIAISKVEGGTAFIFCRRRDKDNAHQIPKKKSK